MFDFRDLFSSLKASLSTDARHPRDTTRMTIAEAHAHYRAGKAFPPRIFLDTAVDLRGVPENPAQVAAYLAGKRGCEDILLQGIDFGPQTTVALDTFRLEVDGITAGKLEHCASFNPFAHTRHLQSSLYLHHSTIGVVETRHVQRVHANLNHGGLDVSAKGANEIYLYHNLEQTGLHVDLRELKIVIVEGCDALQDAALDFIPVPYDGQTQRILTDGTHFCFHKIKGDEHRMRAVLHNRIVLSEDLLGKAFEENRDDAGLWQASEAPRIAECRAVLDALDNYRRPA